MTDYWNAFFQWLHTVGLHPNRDAVEQAARQAGDAMASAASEFITTTALALCGGAPFPSQSLSRMQEP